MEIFLEVKPFQNSENAFTCLILILCRKSCSEKHKKDAKNIYKNRLGAEN